MSTQYRNQNVSNVYYYLYYTDTRVFLAAFVAYPLSHVLLVELESRSYPSDLPLFGQLYRGAEVLAELRWMLGRKEKQKILLSYWQREKSVNSSAATRPGGQIAIE